MSYGDDIFLEPDPIDPDTLANLGPLGPMAGIWEGTKGLDLHPESYGPLSEPYRERYELQPIDPQTNGPQLFYGLRYRTFIRRLNEEKAFHDQVGFWLWEPATGAIIQTLAIPRGQVAMAGGVAAPDAKRFKLKAELSDPLYGILSNPFLDKAYKTLSWTIAVTVHDDGSWSYDQDTVLQIEGQEKLFHHTDRNRLTRVAPATPNPLAREAKAV
ncbi:MAG: heme-binding beta-barrel domain-containing protein [Caulobacteraceae bacterium]|nr:heme-binding beta-barrel domain-containing protein [Caulobacteraceae bacterium]